MNAARFDSLWGLRRYCKTSFTFWPAHFRPTSTFLSAARARTLFPFWMEMFPTSSKEMRPLRPHVQLVNHRMGRICKLLRLEYVKEGFLVSVLLSSGPLKAWPFLTSGKNEGEREGRDEYLYAVCERLLAMTLLMKGGAIIRWSLELKGLTSRWSRIYNNQNVFSLGSEIKVSLHESRATRQEKEMNQRTSAIGLRKYPEF